METKRKGSKSKATKGKASKNDFLVTNIELNKSLLNNAQKLSKIKTKKEVVNKALEEYVKYLKRVEVTKLRGKVEFWDGYENQI